MKTFLSGGLKALLGLLAVTIAPVLPAQVIINEVMADNQTTLFNEGIYPDWVELHNTGAEAVNLSDWSLSGSTDPRQYVFPAGTSIPAGGFLLVYCDQLTNAPGLHANFRLGRSGDDVALYRAPALDGSRQDFVTFGIQVADFSISRVTSGPTGAWAITTPTPEAVNGNALPQADVINLKINEVMANPPSGEEDWFELYNPETSFVHLGGLVWSDRTNTLTTNKPIANLSFIAPGGFIQFIADDRDADADHTSFKLGNSGDTITLFGRDLATPIDRIVYTNAQVRNVSFGRLPDGSTNIISLGANRATPAASNFQLLTDILINEVLTHTDPPKEDAIELHNPTANPVDISYWWLSNSKDDPKKFQIPANTIVPPGGYHVFYEIPRGVGGFNPNGEGTNRSFTLNSARGDQVYVHNADAAGNLLFARTSRDFGPAENGVSFGRYITSEGKTDFVAMRTNTFGVTDPPTSQTHFRSGGGLTNPYPKIGPLIINEIMYHPPDIDQGTNTVDNGLDEYIEIFNITGSDVRLYDVVYPTNAWRVRGTVDFNFPMNVTLSRSNYLLVVNFNPTTNLTQLDAFRSKYAVPTNIQIFGPYSSKLANGGGNVELYKPDPPQALDRPDPGLVPYIRVERVEYNDEAPWPVSPDGTGTALQRLHAMGYANDPTNWIAAVATPGATFIPNTPPTIAPIADITTNELRRIQFFVTATDTNEPQQAITFSLVSPPLGAAIQPNGYFRWRPSELQGPNTYTITVRATDSGNPPLSSTQSFQIVVNEVNRPPSFYTRHRHVKAGTTLSFLTARDEDYPPQFLDFSIIGTPPEGLSIDSAGQITWSPTDAQASTNAYLVTVEATDDGEPILSSRYTYYIYVAPSSRPFILVDVSFGFFGELVLEWDATINSVYAVQVSDSLTSPNWRDVDFPFADRTRMSWVDPDPRTGARFYRIRLDE